MAPILVYIIPIIVTNKLTTKQLCYQTSNDKLCKVKSTLEYYLKQMNRCKCKPKLVVFYTIVAENRILFTHI